MLSMRYDLYTDDKGLAVVLHRVLDRDYYEDASESKVIYSFSGLYAQQVRDVGGILTLCPENLEIRTSTGNFIWPVESKDDLAAVIDGLK